MSNASAEMQAAAVKSVYTLTHHATLWMKSFFVDLKRTFSRNVSWALSRDRIANLLKINIDTRRSTTADII